MSLTGESYLTAYFIFKTFTELSISRDIHRNNVMMDADPLFPHPYHPGNLKMRRDFKGRAQYYSRSHRPVRYYFIDFGLSRQYAADNPSPLELPIKGGDKSVPEHNDYTKAHNPYFTDVYCLGNMVRTELTQV